MAEPYFYNHFWGVYYYKRARTEKNERKGIQWFTLLSAMREKGNKWPGERRETEQKEKTVERRLMWTSKKHMQCYKT